MRLLVVAALVAVACADHHMSGDMHSHGKKMEDMMMGMDKEQMKKMIDMKAKMSETMMKMMMKMMLTGKSMDMSNKTMTDHIRMMGKIKLNMMKHKMNITFDAMKTMELMDTDKDGDLSWDEYRASQMRMDADKDGKVNTTEWVGASMYGGWTMRSALYIFFRLDNNKTDDHLEEREFRMAFDGMDMNNNDKVCIREFSMATGMMIGAMAKHHMRAPGILMIFNASDADMDGSLTAKELTNGAMNWDTDKSGSLSEMEFVKGWVMATNSTIMESKMFFAMLDSISKKDKMITADDLNKLATAMDWNKDKLISKDEFLNGMVYFAARIDEKIMMKVAERFMKMDTNMDGMVTFTESENRLKSWDKNMDNKLNYSEFVGGAVANGASQTEALYAFFIMDNNTNQQLEHEEFRQAYMHIDMDMNKKVNFMEYAHHKHEMAMQMDRAMKLKPELEKMFYEIDTNKTGFMTESQILTAFKAAIPTMKLSKKDYIAQWTNRTGFSKHEAELLFSMVDYSTMDGIYDDRDEKKYFQNGDYNKDGKMSMDEYLNQYLWYWARINVATSKDKMKHMHMMMKSLMMTKMHHMMMHKKMHMTMEKMNITFNGTKAFMAIDSNKDMKISEDEYLKSQWFMDADKDGKINTTEYVNGAGSGGWPASAALYLFHRIDNNTDMMLDEAEFKMAFKGMDVNHDKSVCMMEFGQTIAMSVMAMAYHHKMKPALEKIFNTDDTDKSGKWSMDEFKKAIRNMDENKDGKVTKDEFVKAWVMSTNSTIMESELFYDMLDYRSQDGNLGDDDLKGIFDGMDYGKDGEVDMDEFMNTMIFFAAKIDNEIMKKVYMSFAKADTNKDGQVCTKEFHEMFKPWDKNMDNKLNYTEFVGGAIAAGKKRDEALYFFFMADNNTDGNLDEMEMMKVFKHADMDKSMKISFMEHAHVKHEMAMQLDKAHKMVPMLTALIKPADANKDGFVTEAELIASYKMNGGDGRISKDQYVASWMNISRMDKHSTEIFFSLADGSTKDGVYDEKDQKKYFAGADYNRDGKMSMQEYLDSMLWFWAQINKRLGMEMMEKMKHKMMIMAAAGSFDGKGAFKMTDADGSGDVTEQEFAGLYTKMGAGATKVSDKQFIGSFMKVKMPEMAALYLFFRTDKNEDTAIDTAERDQAFNSFDANKDKKISMKEYHDLMMKMMSQFAMLKQTGVKVDMNIFNALDDNLDGYLTAAEMKSMISHMDKDMDGMVSENEFAAKWSKLTGVSDADSRKLFSYMDGDDDGFFGNDLELTGLFKGFDYDNDSKVSNKEFKGGLLFFAARAQGEKDAAAVAKQTMKNTMKDAVLGFYF